jgi:hypothetical protein
MEVAHTSARTFVSNSALQQTSVDSIGNRKPKATKFWIQSDYGTATGHASMGEDLTFLKTSSAWSNQPRGTADNIHLTK